MHSCVSLMFWGCLSLLTELQSFRSTEFLTYTVTVTQFVVEGPICKNIGFGVSEGRILTLCVIVGWSDAVLKLQFLSDRLDL